MDKKTPISVYNYSSASDFLYDTYVDLKRRRPKYSIRAWSKKLNADNPSSLARILNGERKIPRRMVPEFVKFLGLDQQERAYFEVLAIAEGRITNESKDLVLESIKNRTLGL